MNIGWKQVFEELPPPPGGIEALRSRLNEASAGEIRPRRLFRKVKWTFAAAAACAVIGLIFPGSLLLGVGSAGHQLKLRVTAEGNPALVRLGLGAPPTEAVSVPPNQRHRIAVERVSVDNPNVLFYRVAVLPKSGVQDAD